jgi:hypothetical protein
MTGGCGHPRRRNRRISEDNAIVCVVARRPGQTRDATVPSQGLPRAPIISALHDLAIQEIHGSAEYSP